MVYIGIGGKNCAGKDTAALYLIKKGFEYYSLSEVLREILIEKKIPLNRKNLILYANKLRQENGPSFLAKKVVERINNKKNGVIVSIRNLAEVNELRKLPDFYLLIIDSDPKTRYKRMIERNREGDPKTFEDFLRFERLEEANSETGQQLKEVLKAGDFKIENNSTKEELYKKIEQILELIKK
ncbi:MAG: AAA family ATPase [Candidatus Anstonellaceae archaeon]